MDLNCLDCSKQILESPSPDSVSKLLPYWDPTGSVNQDGMGSRICSHYVSIGASLKKPVSCGLAKLQLVQLHLPCSFKLTQCLLLQISQSQLFIIWMVASYLCPLICLSKFL